MQIIACYSNKGGVGKTAAAVNLAYAFAASGCRTLLCDLDPQGASGFHFRVNPSKKLSGASFFEDGKLLARAIRGSDYDNLDILPANTSFRDVDAFLARVRKVRSRLKKTMKAVRPDYDVLLLDCPPGISMLSESVFGAADAVIVPVIPTTLSQRAFGQLLDFSRESDLPEDRIHAFFSMVQGIKSLHGEVMGEMTRASPGRFTRATIPFASGIERMGLARAPLLATAPNRRAGRAYQALFDEIEKRIGA